MAHLLDEPKNREKVTFRTMSTPAKSLATCVILTLTFGMLGAMGQIVIHDIIPTFYTKNTQEVISPSPTGHDGKPMAHMKSNAERDRGDLFADLSTTESQPEIKPFYKDEQFVWTLKWTHIHLFGMSMIFIFMGTIALFLDTNSTFRTWLVVLPFIGVLIDISAMWLKAFISPVFFWLHIPGGGVFAIIFGYVSLRALWEMWIKTEYNPG